MNSDSKTSFFIFGHPRSGTTALAQLINASAQAACLYSEGNVLYRLWQTLQRHKILDEPISDLIIDFKVTVRHNLAEQAVHNGCKKNHFTKHAIKQLVQAFRQSLQTTDKPQEIYKTVSRVFFKSFAKSVGENVVGDKVPDFINIPEHITAPHPDCRIINITRDPRAIIHSTLCFNRSNLHLFAVPSAFAMAVSYSLKQKGLEQFWNIFPTKLVLSIEHQELLCSPKKIGGKALHFLGTCPDEDFFSFARNMQSRRKNVKKWQQEMSQEDQNAVTAACVTFGCAKELEQDAHPYWQEKAMALKELFTCASPRIKSIVATAGQVFKTENDRKELGLSLMQFADYAHNRSDFPRAKALFDEAFVYITEHPILWYKYGSLCFDMKRLDSGLFYLKKLEDVCPSTPYYNFLRAKGCYLLGRIYRLQGNISKAEFFFKKTTTIKPGFKLADEMLSSLKTN